MAVVAGKPLVVGSAWASSLEQWRDAYSGVLDTQERMLLDSVRREALSRGEKILDGPKIIGWVRKRYRAGGTKALSERFDHRPTFQALDHRPDEAVEDHIMVLVLAECVVEVPA